VEEEADLVVRADFAFFNLFHLMDLARICASADALGVVERLLERVVPNARREHNAVLTANAVLAEAAGGFNEAAQRYSDAAEAWRRFPFPLEEGLALLGAGRCLVALGEGANQELRGARELLLGLGARPSVVEADALLARSIAQTS